jgi:hypothetical protein
VVLSKCVWTMSVLYWNTSTLFEHYMSHPTQSKWPASTTSPIWNTFHQLQLRLSLLCLLTQLRIPLLNWLQHSLWFSFHHPPLVVVMLHRLLCTRILGTFYILIFNVLDQRIFRASIRVVSDKIHHVREPQQYIDTNTT